jgi:hypothetical protein
MNAWLDSAISKLYPFVMEWIHSPSVGKAALMKAWQDLSEREKKAIDRDVLEAVQRNHGADEFMAWRYKGLTAGKLGGTSLTTKEPTYLSRDKYRAYLVNADEVMVHWGQEDMPLSSQAFGHEQEIILKPNAVAERET